MTRKNPVMVETWKGRRYVVARTPKGTILTRTKYNAKVKVATYRERFKHYNSFSENIRVTRFGAKTDYKEYSDFSKKPKPKIKKFQYYINGTYYNEPIGSGSRHMQWDSVDKARKEALSNFHSAVLRKAGYAYDDNEALYDFEKGGVRIIEEGVRWYA